MRTSTKKTTAAVLRSLIGIKDFEMAGMIERTPATIHSIESGRLKLSEDLAARMAHETGVAIGWLLNGDPKAPIVDRFGHPYTEDVFARSRAKKPSFTAEILLPVASLQFYANVRSILRTAYGVGDFSLANYKIRKAIKTLEEQFGSNEKLKNDGTRKTFLSQVQKVFNTDFRAATRVMPDRFALQLGEGKGKARATKPTSKRSSKKRRKAKSASNARRP